MSHGQRRGIPAYARNRLQGLVDVRARYEAMHEGPLRVDSRMTVNPVLSVVIDNMHVDEVHIDGGRFREEGRQNHRPSTSNLPMRR
jgi:hypothetical protein